MRRTVRFVALAAAAALIGASGFLAAADSYPSKAIRMIVPYSAGGSGDAVGRLLAAALKPILGHPVIIDNRPGAGGNIGAQATAIAAPDGYTILMAATSLASNPSLVRNMPFDPLKDLTPISGYAEYPLVVVVNPSLPIRSIKDLVAYAKASPGKLNFSSSGIGTTSHLAGELFKVLAQVDMTHVPYKADAAALPDLLSGRVNLMFMIQATALPQVRSGKLRALAVTSAKRSALLPDLPTVAQAGVATYEVRGWYGLFAPAGTPGVIVDKLAAAAVEAVQSPGVRARLLEQGFAPVGSGSEQFAAFFRNEVQKWDRVVKQGGVPRLD
jgi:tripartite-type tricarboxylate transporter receptor subunit TctC